jgi:hypothetical protein
MGLATRRAMGWRTVGADRRVGRRIVGTAALSRVVARREHARQRRQHEAGGLAAAGARRDRQVAALERRRDRA